jgi:hypothetical protein
LKDAGFFIQNGLAAIQIRESLPPKNRETVKQTANYWAISIFYLFHPRLKQLETAKDAPAHADHRFFLRG